MIRRRRFVLPTVMGAVMALGATGGVLGHRSWRHHQAVEEAENQHRADVERQRAARVREAAAAEAARSQAAFEALRREKEKENTCYMRELKVNPYFAEGLNRAHQEQYGHRSATGSKGVVSRGAGPANKALQRAGLERRR